MNNIWTEQNGHRACQSGPGTGVFLHTSLAFLQLLFQAAEGKDDFSLTQHKHNTDFKSLYKMLQWPFQVGVHIVIAVVFRQVNQHPRSTAAFSGTAEAAVADPSAWRTLPLLPGAKREEWVTLVHFI